MNDVFFKIGLITIIGLSAKNAILIVEFAKMLKEEGMSLIEATVAAAKLRLRPILMTSLAFTCGVIPLVIASGASSETQHALGTGGFWRHDFSHHSGYFLCSRVFLSSFWVQ